MIIFIRRTKEFGDNLGGSLQGNLISLHVVVFGWFKSEVSCENKWEMMLFNFLKL